MGDIFSNNKRRKLSHGWTCKDQRGEREAGLSQRKSNIVIPVEECLCAENAVNNYLKNTAEKSDSRPKGRCHLFGSSFGDKKDLWETIFNSESGHGGLRSGDLGHWF